MNHENSEGCNYSRILEEGKGLEIHAGGEGSE